jgi:acyl-CoA synthetase (AMP-forming)/AMP-acid ligase II
MVQQFKLALGSRRNGCTTPGEADRKRWLATYGARIPAEINPNAHGSVLAMLEGAMKRFADRPAFRCFGQTLTYADTDRLVAAVRGLPAGPAVRVKKGDRVAVMLPNIPAFPIAMLGIVRAGAAQVNVNPLYTRANSSYPAQRRRRRDHRHLQAASPRASVRSSAKQLSSR